MKRKLLALLLLGALAVLPVSPAVAAAGPNRPAGRIVLIGDPHLPGRHLPAKEALLRRIDGWPDIDRVVVLGDLCQETGTAEEVAAAKQFFAPLRHPLRPVTGNHDYLYRDEPDGEGRKMKAPADIRRRKLARFVETFGMKALYHSEPLGGYRLFYLAADHLESDQLARLSEEQLAWLRDELARHRQRPSIVFFHAPLEGTLKPYNQRANRPAFVAQPAGELRALIRANPQLFLWAAGHMHVPATNESYSAPVNLYDNRVTVIHNADLQRQRPWTNVLDLHPDRVVVRTYDHGREGWRDDLERTIPAPGL